MADYLLKFGFGPHNLTEIDIQWNIGEVQQDSPIAIYIKIKYVLPINELFCVEVDNLSLTMEFRPTFCGEINQSKTD